LALACASLSQPTAAGAQQGQTAQELPLNAPFRYSGFQPGPESITAARFRLEIPEPGLLALDLTGLGDPRSEPLLRPLAPAAAVAGSDPALILHRTPTSILVALREAGAFSVEVAAVDLDQSLPAFKLWPSFLPLSSLPGDPFINAVDPWDDEIDPKPPGQGGGVAPRDLLCSLGEHDDHGDTPLCATPLPTGSFLTGELLNDAGDDEDIFSFRLQDPTAISLEVVSSLAVRTALRDRNGMALAIAESEGEPLRLARVLAAGRYFLEVEGRYGDSGVYALTLRQHGQR
jgi:hypothetical protein